MFYVKFSVYDDGCRTKLHWLTYCLTEEFYDKIFLIKKNTFDDYYCKALNSSKKIAKF